MKCICKICKENSDNIRKLSKHIRDKHKNVTIKEYYDTFLKKPKEGECVVCSKETQYKHLGVGYTKVCSAPCAGKYSREKLKKDKIKNDIFVKKVKENMFNEWKKREKTNQKKIIIEKIKNTKKQKISEMAKEERIKKFGWMNKLSLEEKEKFIQKNYWDILYVYWQNLSDEDFKKIINKRGSTMLERQKTGFIFEVTEKESIKFNENMERIFGLK